MNSKIQLHHTYTYDDTLFKSNKNVAGVVIEPKTTATASDNKTMLSHMFNGECAIIHFTGTIPCQTSIYKEVVSWSREDTIEDSVVDTVPLYSTDGEVALDFRLRFLESGEYKLYFEFYALSSQVFTKVVNVSITDDCRNQLSMYKVQTLPVSSLMTSEEIYNTLNIKGLTFQLGDSQNVQYSEHSQFLCYDKTKYDQYIGLTHTIVVPLIDLAHSPSGYYILTTPGGQTFKDQDLLTESGLNDFIAAVGDFYWVYVTDRIQKWDWGEDKETAEKTLEPTLICIKKDFSWKNELTVSFTSFDPNNPTIIPHYVDEHRFYPLFHRLVEFDNSYSISRNDIIYIAPTIKHSKPISDCNWEFFNATTLETTKSYLHTKVDFVRGKRMGIQDDQFVGGTQSVLFAPYHPQIMDPGYYDIKLNYKEGETEQTIQLKSAFLLHK